MSLSFEWDEENSRDNQRKHGVSFQDAKTVFDDPLAITVYDPDHSTIEVRYIDPGLSSNGRYPVICYTERGETIRFVSSRAATQRERRNYEGQ